jgi:RNA polymerase sigma-70 factor (ECF subfamily)
MPRQQTALRESDLVDRARERDESAIRIIIQRHNRRLYRIARGVLRDDAEAEDAVQETYLKAFLHLDEFRGDAAVGTWLCRIVMNEALDRLRRRRPMLDWSTMEENGKPGADIIRLPVNASRPDPERAAAQRQIQALLEHAIDELPEDFRMVLVARAIEEMSVEETAALLNIRPETVKTRLHRARHRLRTVLEAKIGPVFKDVFPFEDPRCERIADALVAQLNLRNESREPLPPASI